MPDNPYTSVSISGYNSSPPPDAGETTAANTLEWQKHLDKIGDPLNTFAAAIDTNVLAAMAKLINTDADQNNSMAGSLAFAQSTKTIASGSFAATRTAHLVAAETGTADDLANITTGSVSDFALLLIQNDSGDTITVKDAATGAGEIHLADNADFALSGDFSLLLQRRGADWYEIARSQGFSVDVQSFTASGTWTKTGLGTYALVEVWGAGGSGGKAQAAAHGGGGGGGGYKSAWFLLTALGANETVTIGAGATSVTGANTNGAAGGNTTFGSLLKAWGGGGGDGGAGVNSGGGGGGGGIAAGTTATTSTGAVGGGPAGSAAAADNAGYGGAGGGTGATSDGGAAAFGGGGGGGGVSGTGKAGGASQFGGGGGGGAGDTTAGAGGTSEVGGNGGAGGADANAGTAGTQPGGGGGGTETGNSGAGADGQCRVTVV